MEEAKLREEILAACLRMDEARINQGTSGNISVRWRDGLLITPTGLAYEQMTPADLVYLRMDGSYEGDKQPSSEWRFHRDILRSKPAVNAVVHAHPTFCTILSIRRQEIPAIHYMIAAAGGSSIPCAAYATFGSKALSQNVLAVLEDRQACLLANHGMIAIGADLAKALWLAIEVETLARQYVGVLQAGGGAVLLSEEEIARIRKKFESYGRQKAGP